MRTHKKLLLSSLIIALLFCACSKKVGPTTTLRHFPADDLTGIIDKARVVPDQEITSDGNGSLRIDASGPTTVRLYEVDRLNIDKAQIVYRAKLRTRSLDGEAYLEMWCHFPDQGDYFSRDVENSRNGTSDWGQVETPFMLEEGQVVKSIRLNLVVLGRGTVWIDDIDLMQAPLGP